MGRIAVRNSDHCRACYRNGVIMRSISLFSLLLLAWTSYPAHAQEIPMQNLVLVTRDTVPGQKGGKAHRILVKMLGPTGYMTYSITFDPSRDVRDFLVGGKKACWPFGAKLYQHGIVCPTAELAEAKYQEVFGAHLKPSTIAEERLPAVT